MENIIKIHLKQSSDYKNTYNEKIISYNLSNYIFEELKGIALNEKIKFVISSDFYMDKEEQENFVYMIRKNFGADITEIINLSKKQRISNYLILLLGIIFILIYSIFNLEVVSQFILIFGWVFIGESICNFFYKGIENKYQIMRRKQVADAKIIFDNNEEEI